MQHINKLIYWLQKENYKSFYLALMRVLLSIFLLKEIILKQSAWSLLYSNNSLLQFNTHSAFVVLGVDITTLKNYYLYIIFTYIFSLLLFLFGIGKNLIVAFVFLLLLTLQKLNNAEVNGGDILARLILFYFIFANSFQYFSYKKNIISSPTKNVISNLAAFSMMLQLCIAYYFSFYHKVCNLYWTNGSAMYYVFNTKEFIATNYNQILAQQNWFVYFTTYFTLVVELCFPFLIWFNKTRKPIMVAGLLLHLGIYFFMMLYNLQIIFLLIYGLFFTNEEWLNFCKKRFKFLKIE